MKWNPLPVLRAVSRFAYESAAQRIAATVLFALICLCASLVGLGFFLAYCTLRRLLFVLVVLVLASCAAEGVSSSPCATCAGEGVNQITDAKVPILCVALAGCAAEGVEALDAGAPFRGPAALDAGAEVGPVADALPDVVPSPPEVAPDLAPDMMPPTEVRTELPGDKPPLVLSQLPRCEDRDSGTGINIMCDRRSALPDGGLVYCLEVAREGGYFGAVPCFFPSDGLAVSRVYVPSCEVCP